LGSFEMKMDETAWSEFQHLTNAYNRCNQQNVILYTALVDIIKENGGYLGIDEFMHHFKNLPPHHYRHYPKEQRIVYEALKGYQDLV
jgi:hypothetical protein